MSACYRPEATFQDPVFRLEGWRIGAMWRMLCERGNDLRIEFGAVDADESTGSAEWQAWYTFSATGRPVHNRIRARFEFKDGGVVRHQDAFPFHRWAGQALGLPGRLLGWAPPFRALIRRRAVRALAGYVRQRELGPP